jgi:hypothetical protein
MKAAWLELFWHEVLHRSGYEVEVHPTIANVATNPDFLANRDGAQFYLEATLAMAPDDPAAERKLAELHDTLDRMDSPDYFLEFQYRGSPEGNIRGRSLRERLERWLRQPYQDQNYGAVPTFTLDEQGVSLTFIPIPKDRARGQAFRSYCLHGRAHAETPGLLRSNTHDGLAALPSDNYWLAAQLRILGT